PERRPILPRAHALAPGGVAEVAPRRRIAEDLADVAEVAEHVVRHRDADDGKRLQLESRPGVEERRRQESVQLERDADVAVERSAVLDEVPPRADEELIAQSERIDPKTEQIGVDPRLARGRRIECGHGTALRG